MNDIDKRIAELQNRMKELAEDSEQLKKFVAESNAKIAENDKLVYLIQEKLKNL